MANIEEGAPNEGHAGLWPFEHFLIYSLKVCGEHTLRDVEGPAWRESWLEPSAPEGGQNAQLKALLHKMYVMLITWRGTVTCILGTRVIASVGE
jgi:hypothetical protein